MPKSYFIKFPSVVEIGNRVSHAKNRTKHPFRANLHRATIIVEGVKKKVLVPSRVLKVLKREGLTTHFKKPEN